MKQIAVYPGTFDPVTNGHLDIIERASKMFDTLYVTIFDHPSKVRTFSVEKRLELLKEATKEFDNVIVDYSSKLQVEYAREKGAGILVRGLRATMDFEYELQLAFSNQYLDSEIEMVFLMTRMNHTFISSSTIKEMASHHHSVKGLVPECVEIALKNGLK